MTPVVLDPIGQLEKVRELIRRDPLAAIEQATQYLDASEDDGRSIELQLMLSRAYIHLGKYSDGHAYAERAFLTAKYKDYRRLEGMSANELGIYCFVNNQFDEALHHYAYARSLFERHGSPDDLAKVYTNVGNVYVRRRQYFEGVLAYEQALDLLGSSKDALLEAKILTNLSSLYQYVLQDSETADTYTKKAIVLFRELEDATGLGKALHNHAQFLRRQDLIDESIPVYLEALELRKVFSEPVDLALNFGGLVAAYTQTRQLEKAQDTIVEAESLLQAVSGTTNVIQYFNLPKAEYLLAIGKTEEAASLARQLYQWATDSDQNEYLQDILDLHARTLMAQGEYRQAAELMQGIISTSTSVNKERLEARLLYVKRQIDQVQSLGFEEQERLRSVEVADAFRKMKEAQKENEEYIAFLAHELKNPLATIRSISQLIAKDPHIIGTETALFINEIDAITARVFDMTTRVLSGARHTEGYTTLSIDARMPFHHVIGASKHVAAQKGIELAWTCTNEPVMINGDDASLVVIYDNLVSNAIKYSPSNSTVTVSLGKSFPADASPSMLFSVKDSGPGISSEDMNQLYKQFTTLTAKPTGAETSSGLGLHLVRRAVDHLSGRVWCDSILGTGCTFYVEFPLSAHTPLNSEVSPQ